MVQMGQERACLLVMDDDALAATVSRIAADLDASIQLRIERTAAAAMESMARRKPDLVLLDLSLADAGGLALLHAMKSSDGLHNAPVIVLHAAGSEADVQRCYALGANTFITRPHDEASSLGVFRSLFQFWFNVAELPPS
jgi:two-component system response regulator